MSDNLPDVAETIKGLRDSNSTLRRLTDRHLPLLDDAALLLESLSARATQAETTVQARSIVRLSEWIDASYPADIDPELHLRRRVGKLMEETGEVGQALGGYTGENPRKGVTHSREDLMGELLDVAITALGAWEHMDGNRGRSGHALAVKLDSILNRAGLGAEPGHMIRGYSLEVSAPLSPGTGNEASE